MNNGEIIGDILKICKGKILAGMAMGLTQDNNSWDLIHIRSEKHIKEKLEEFSYFMCLEI